ncbi:MAG: TonB-dependent siderophore receptor [Rhodocyclaceae bacterium]|nr:TonB-dependent siderophore receptor [Rhodocyclaceae bacterium]
MQPIRAKRATQPAAPRRKTAVAVHAALLAIGLAAAIPGMTRFAQAAESAAAVTAFDIPAGALDAALARFGQASGALLSYSPELAAGRRSPGVSGAHTIPAALARLLAGTGLEAVPQANGGYTLRVSPTAASDATLRAVTVTADGLRNATTEGSGSYTTPSMSTATKLPLSLRETPQSVTVITRERMDDQGLITASELLKNTPGITVTATAPYRETFFARGYAIENYLFDGLPVTTNSSRRGTFLNDLAMYDRVEVVRGAAGLTQGTGTPSAALNFVRKRPTRDFQASVQGQAGRWNHYGAEADVSGPLNASGSLRGRAVVHWHDSDSFMDVVDERRQLFYLIGEADLTARTLLTLSLARQENDNTTTYGGLPTALDGGDLKLPRSTFLGNKWNYWDDDTTSLFASLEHRFDSGWKLNFAINRIWGEQEQLRAGVTWNANLGQWDQTGGKASLYNDRTSYDLHAQGPFRLFGREHELVVGASKRTADEGNDTAGYWSLLYAQDIDIYDWHHNAPKPASFLVDYYQRTEERQHGFYGTTRLNLADPLKLILGLRADWFEFSSRQRVLNQAGTAWTASASGYDYDRHLTKYAGLVYDLNRQHSAYLSYTDVFKPQNARSTSNDFITPIVGKNYEAGVKGEYFGGALNASASVFRMNQENLAMSVGACPFNANMTCYEATGMARSEGYELEVQGALTPNWQIGAGYTYVTTEVRKDSNPARVGLRLNTQMPTRQFKLSTSYRLPDGKWRVGGSLRWQNDIHYQWTGGNYRSEQDAYAIVDAMVGYRHDRHLDIQLNVGNLFDKVYYSSINAQPVIWGGNSVYGTPRSVMLTARYRF